MAELKRIDEEYPAAELATDGIPPKQPEGPKLVKGQEAETLDRGAAISKPMALFLEPEMGDFRSQWSKLQIRIRGRATPDCRRRRQAGSCGDAATRGRFCQRAVGIGKAVGQR
jgi:hypothetical protein